MPNFSARARALLFLLAIACAALSGFHTVAARADEFRARYTVSLIGLNIGEISAAGTIGPAAYRINLNAKLTGIAALISNLKLALSATGAVRRSGLAPTTYATTSANSQGARTVRMSLDSGNVRAVEIFPPFEEKAGRIPVSEANKRNILDPTSALIMPVPENEPLVGPAACNRTIPVFDGYVRFNVTLYYVGTKEVAVDGYTGPVSVCAARYTPISGHTRDSKSTKFMAENRDIETWLAPVARARAVVPLHVELMTMAGAAVIDATEFSVSPPGVTATTAH
ncbi:MAG: DUF3108 domain-containing protein [Beijerinckiaceae bacterium]|nr:DUF3108 domain-containing protein [Beijerinckiaceae bacterium]